MATRRFSRFDDTSLLDDEDDEGQRARLLEKAKRLYAQAEQAHLANPQASEEMLKIFLDAEASLDWVIQQGVSALRHAELQHVLKGRLYQAVILSQLEARGQSRWPKVQALAEEILQFDFDNCDARYLRGLALQHGGDPRRRSVAEEEMRRAVELARQQGKSAQASAWESQVDTLRNTGTAAAASSTTSAPPDGPAKAAAAASTESMPSTLRSAPCAEQIAAAASAAVHASTSSSPASSTLKKGFFDAPAKRGQPKAVAAARVPQQQQLEAQAKAQVSAAEAAKRMDREAEIQRQREEDEEEERRQQAEIDLVSEQLNKERRLQAQLVRRRRNWRRNAERDLEELGSELDSFLRRVDAKKQSADAVVAGFDKLATAAAKANEQMTAAGGIADTHHQRFMDLTTEVAKLHDLVNRERHEQKEGSRQQTVEFQDFRGRLDGLKDTTRTLCSNLRSLGFSGDDADEDDDDTAEAVAQLTEEMRSKAALVREDFRALPLSVKLSALLEDSGVMWLAAVAMLCGAMFGLALSVEGFGVARCRLVCSITAAAAAPTLGVS